VFVPVEPEGPVGPIGPCGPIILELELSFVFRVKPEPYDMIIILKIINIRFPVDEFIISLLVDA
jgi:hypothetical protein